MKKIVATEAPKSRSEPAVKLAWLYAGILVVMALGQLYAFEKFVPLIAEYQVFGDNSGLLIASLIVIAEVFALPFLLRMRVSIGMRWLSLLCSLVAVGVWAKLSLWAMLTDKIIDNSGILGTKVTVPSGEVTLLLSIGLLALASYCAWGLWPGVTKKK